MKAVIHNCSNSGNISKCCNIALIIMEKQLNCALKLSLKEMALRKVVVNLWTENDILAIIENLRDYFFKVWRDVVENQVKNKVSKLVLPKSLKNQMMCLVRPIGSDILRWKRYHEYYLMDANEFFGMHILKQLHWTCVGAIDYRKTAEELIRLEMLDIVKLYRLACFYCLVDYIPLLWEELGEESQSEFYGDDPFDIIIDRQLVYIWPYILKGEESVLDKIANSRLSITKGMSFNQCVIESSACVGNKAATEYFLQLLSPEERDASLMTAFCAVINSRGHKPWTLPPIFLDGRLGDVLHYLLSVMSPEQQMEVLRQHPCHILCCFLDWPWHDLFLDITDVAWTFLPKSRYIDLLYTVRNFGFYFPNLFQKLFLNSPSEFRKEFVFCQFQLCLFAEFFCDEDIETIKVVLRNVSASARLNLVSSYNFFGFLDDLLMKDKWYFVDLCFREAALSKENKEILKNRFMEFLERKYTSENLARKHEWKRFFELLDETDASAPNKRSLEDGTVIKV